MRQKILITGGSGFLGSHLASRLRANHDITISDHNPTSIEGVTWCHPDVVTINQILKDTDIVVHLASRNGIEGSMISPSQTLQTNIVSSALLYEEIRKSNVKKVILTSSTTVYGEGSYKCQHCHEHIDPVRDFDRYKSWECHCANCGNEVRPLPTSENFVGNPLSFYALSKLTQEKMFNFLIGYGHSVDILRFPIVYGPGQTERRKYSGAIGSFVKSAIEDKEVEILEDGHQLRDFIYIDDCIDAIEAMINRPGISHLLNIATGRKNSLLDVCREIEKHLGKSMKIKVTNTHRLGDSRHNVVSTTKATGTIGFSPKYDLKSGIEKTIKHVLPAT